MPSALDGRFVNVWVEAIALTDFLVLAALSRLSLKVGVDLGNVSGSWADVTALSARLAGDGCRLYVLGAGGGVGCDYKILCEVAQKSPVVAAEIFVSDSG